MLLCFGFKRAGERGRIPDGRNRAYLSNVRHLTYSLGIVIPRMLKIPLTVSRLVLCPLTPSRDYRGPVRRAINYRIHDPVSPASGRRRSGPAGQSGDDINHLQAKCRTLPCPAGGAVSGCGCKLHSLIVPPVTTVPLLPLMVPVLSRARPSASFLCRIQLRESTTTYSHIDISGLKSNHLYSHILHSD